MIFHFQWHLALTLPSPRDGATGLVQLAGRGMKGTVVEISNLTQFLILIVILLLILKQQEITIMIKIRIKRRRVAKHSLNSMAVGMKGEGTCTF
jgi:hypothetical protein